MTRLLAVNEARFTVKTLRIAICEHFETDMKDALISNVFDERFVAKPFPATKEIGRMAEDMFDLFLHALALHASR